MEHQQPTSSPLSPVKDYKIPPDVNGGDTLLTDQRWYSGLAILRPVFYVSYLIFALIFLILALVVRIVIHTRIAWAFFPEFVLFVLFIKITFIIHFVMIPAFWRARARQIINEGYFDSSTKGNGGKKLVLEIGCNEGKASVIFARAIITRQETEGNPHSSLPIFIGYDKWSAWSRIPNTPACFLSTLRNSGVPRECIVANRMDTASKATKLTLPYASDSISLIICNFGLSELIPLSRADRGTLFQELARILEPEGRIVVVESGDGGRWGRFWKGPVGSYQRILVEKMGWPQENAVVRWDRGLWYLVGVKPSVTRGTV